MHDAQCADGWSWVSRGVGRGDVEAHANIDAVDSLFTVWLNPLRQEAVSGGQGDSTLALGRLLGCGERCALCLPERDFSGCEVTALEQGCGHSEVYVAEIRRHGIYGRELPQPNPLGYGRDGFEQNGAEHRVGTVSHSRRRSDAAQVQAMTD